MVPQESEGTCQLGAVLLPACGVQSPPQESLKCPQSPSHPPAGFASLAAPPLGAAPGPEASLKRPVITSRALVGSSRLPQPPSRGQPPTELRTGQLCHPSLRLEFLLFLSIFGQQPSEKVSLNPQRQAPNTASAYITQRLPCILQSLFLSPILKYYHGRKRIFEGRKQYKMK